MISIPKNNESKSILISLIPFFLFSIVFSAFVLLSEYFQLHVLKDTIEFYRSDLLSDHIEHLYLTTAISGVLLLMILSVSISIYIIRKWIKNASSGAKSWIYLAGIMCFSAVIIALFISNPALNKALGSELLKVCDNIDNGVSCSKVLYYLMISTAIFWGFVVSATSSLLYVKNSDLSAETLANRIKDYKFLLYCAAGVYSIGIITLFLIYHSPEIVIDTTQSTPIEVASTISAASSAKAITTYWAITFSIYICVLFLPVAVIHKGWAKELAKNTGSSIKSEINAANEKDENNQLQSKRSSDSDEDIWLKKNNLATSGMDIFMQIIAYVSPILTGILGSFSSLF